jgi:hypothetical protein
VKLLLSIIVSVFLATTAVADPPTDVLNETHAAVRAVLAVQGEVTPTLIEQPEILGTAVGFDNVSDVPALTVYVDRDAANVGEAIRNLPREIRGIRVHVELTDQMRAMGFTAKQTPPIRLGTSGGWAYDIANSHCCGGTLGALVWIGGYQYILSAWHVLEADYILGDNSRISQSGDPIMQPGLLDVSCRRGLAQTVGALAKRGSIWHSNTDCAVARVVSGRVRTDGWILGIGTISRTISPPALGQRVKKSGRTTGLTRSFISGLNATIKVTLTKECSGPTFEKTFTGQIIVSNPSMTFVRPGDSGSLLVQDIGTNPRALGLLVASNGTQAMANPIAQVLAFLGATMVGK